MCEYHLSTETTSNKQSPTNVTVLYAIQVKSLIKCIDCAQNCLASLIFCSSSFERMNDRLIGWLKQASKPCCEQMRERERGKQDDVKECVLFLLDKYHPSDPPLSGNAVHAGSYPKFRTRNLGFKINQVPTIYWLLYRTY